jgi:transcriptional pleiotropic regulator of transition state genes
LLSTGIVRKTDKLGRINLPKELLQNLDIKEGDPLEISTDGEMMLLEKYSPGCILCGGLEKAGYFKGKLVCNNCLDGLHSE